MYEREWQRYRRSQVHAVGSRRLGDVGAIVYDHSCPGTVCLLKSTSHQRSQRSIRQIWLTKLYDIDIRRSCLPALRSAARQPASSS